MSLHIYAYPWEPLIRYHSPCDGKTVRVSPWKRYPCHECGDIRQAKNLEIQAYYDLVRIRCKGGNHPGWK